MTEIRAQAEIAMTEADVIIAVVDGETGITDADEAVANILYRTDKPVILIVNKVDNPERRMEILTSIHLDSAIHILYQLFTGLGQGMYLMLLFKIFLMKSKKKMKMSSSSA